MTLFQANNDASRPVMRWTALAACVAVVHCFALVICPSLILRYASAGEVVAWAVCYAIIVAAISAAASLIAFSQMPDGSMRREDVVTAFTLAGIWLAPLAVLYRSAWSIAPAMIAAYLLGRSFGPWRSQEPDGSMKLETFAGMTNSGNKQRLKCFGAAIVVQSGVAAGLGGYNVVAAYLLAIGCFLIALWMPPALHRHRSSRTTAIVLLAIFVTTAGLLPLSKPRRTSASTNQQGSGPERKSADELFSGFILIPEVQPHTTIVPPPTAFRRNLFRAGTRQPLSIPFSGEYWIYHWPLGRPPKSSAVARGTPVNFKFTATGNTPLVMQARHSFGMLIGIQCCSRIDVAISNTDPLPGTIEAELKLVNTTVQPNIVQSMGRVTIMSSLPGIVSANTQPATETLKFEIPRATGIREFDLIALIFHLDASRKSRSANIAVERFYLVPQGG